MAFSESGDSSSAVVCSGPIFYLLQILYPNLPVDDLKATYGTNKLIILINPYYGFISFVEGATANNGTVYFNQPQSIIVNPGGAAHQPANSVPAMVQNISQTHHPSGDAGRPVARDGKNSSSRAK